ncbi:MAG: helix-turn-helix transcriptional regulator [Chloroflexi bacterium]|nr:helix-turn-helix transcriptional regulator [Chloroflexota bacterium]
MSNQDPTRAQMLGSLIRDARLYAGREPEETAVVLSLTPETYAQIETGEYATSLPELEVLALFLKVPMGYFWGRDELVTPRPVDYQSLIAIRHRVIGVMLRQLRLQARQTQKDFAAMLGLDEAAIAAYETGATAVPYLHLEQISRHLNVPITYFVDDQHGPLGRHEAEQRLQKIFSELGPDMQAFLTNPTNVTYMQTAKILSEMDVQRLRQVAESILDITF